MEFKTREEELEELLAPDGELNRAVYDAVQGIVERERNPEVIDPSESAYEALDTAINAYMKYAIEWDRLQQKTK